MSIYTYIARYGHYESQTIVIMGKDKTDSLKKLKAYLIEKGKVKLADEAQEKDLTEETEDVFQTHGVDG